MILPDSPEAAKLVTVTGWASRDGHFWGNDEIAERHARLNGATHVYCEGDGCGKPIAKGWKYCKGCTQKKAIQRWKDAPRKAWDGESMLYSDSHDRYFDDFHDVDDFCADNDTTREALLLYICEPNHAKELDGSHFEDELCDDDPELPSELVAAMDAFNAALKAYGKPLSWSPSKFAALWPES